MTLRFTPAASFDALPNPRGGRVPAAQAALANAMDALERRGDAATPLLQAVQALREAGWLAAARFADTLLLASPLAMADATIAAVATGAAPMPGEGRPADGQVRTLFGEALRDLHDALGRRNLRELSCSPALFARQHALCDVLAPHTPGFSLTFEDIALTGRPLPPVTLHAQPAQQLAQLRARYEAALLPALKIRANGSRAATAWAEAAFGEMDACMGELTSADPYDFWRLALACGRSLRARAQAWGEVDARRFYARCNLVLADHGYGQRVAPQSLVRMTLALLWRDYALFGAAAEDADDIELLHDYGLTADWHVAGTQASEALWEADAGAAADASARGGGGSTRELGALCVNANAYEDFLQTADASMTLLAAHAAGDRPARPDAGAALQAADASYRLGAAAWALGLGHVGMLADALGLAWRRTAHGVLAASAVSDSAPVLPPAVPDPAALEQAGEALRAMLHKVAAGVGQPDARLAVAALGRALGQPVPN
ncbi:hypothetical protein CY652_05215 [Burkholderia sp. WAC0059]|uniref:hypothetical protein n=1 Tax=Burkholderia sp. WAC0059 TaxID=2066022 RepID=UPI000C7F284B|nr:hypothetical protein [Burkholderia sp. WAC0059]PLZ03220.1 hypothetical protein CY652_05215 [Burkholderia sp. WAC0059]